MTGDFNMDVNWSEVNSGIIVNISNNNQMNIMSRMMNHFFLKQVITKSTRNHKIIDLLFVNNDQLVINHDVIVNKKFSDHNTVITQLNISVENKRKLAYDCSSLYDTKIPSHKITSEDDR